jgi:hypothetical protein
LICDQVQRVAAEEGTGQIIVAGIGARLFSQELDGIDLFKEIGSYADALPAFSVREVALRCKYS